MQGIEILLVSVLVAFSQGTNSSQFPNWRSSWIEGGSVAATGEFPYLVSLRIPGNHHHCGGSIINEWHILTAAHCVFVLPASSITVVVGTNTLNTGGKKHMVSSIIEHKGFHIVGMIKDIALLKLKQPIAFSPRAQPIKLPSQDQIVDMATDCNFGGWGKTSENGHFSNNLLKLQLRLVRSNQCKAYNANFDDTKLCARAPAGKGPCQGDSGGPLICGGELVGVYTGGGVDTACKTGYPLDFVYVSKYINWIILASI